MSKLKLAYFGTPIFSAYLLEKIIKDKELSGIIQLVVTQPDKLVGRKQILTKSPVKIVAQTHKIEVLDDSESETLLQKIKGLDLAIVYAYGFKKLLPLSLLKAPKIKIKDTGTGFINIHPSLLPLYRGSSPIAYPILLGEKITGVSLFVMDEQMDHGPLIVEIRLNETRSDMESKLTDLGFEILKKLLNSLIRESVNSLIFTPQNHSLATRAPYMIREDGYIEFTTLKKALNNEPIAFKELPQIIQNYLDHYPQTDRELVSKYKLGNYSLDSRLRGNDIFSNSSQIIYDFWRGISPWPGVWTLLEPPRFDTVQKDRISEIKWKGPKRLKITEVSFVDNILQIKKVQLEGKKEVDFTTFQKAYGLL